MQPATTTHTQSFSENNAYTTLSTITASMNSHNINKYIQWNKLFCCAVWKYIFLIFVHRLAFISTALLVFPLDRCDVHLSLPFYLIVLALLSTSECRPSDTPLADVIYIVSFEQKKNASQTLSESEPYALMDKDTCRSRYRRRTMLNAMCSMQHACVCAYVAMMR